MPNIVILSGDGIGPEITTPAVEVLRACAEKYSLAVNIIEKPIGGIAIDTHGTPLPEETIAACKTADAILLGAVGGPKWDGRADGLRPEQGLLQLRSALSLFANLRPATLYDPLKEASPLHPRVLSNGLDIMVVRELTGGIYFGARGRQNTDGVTSAFDTERYSVPEIERIAHVAFQTARKRRKQLCSIDKANVLESSRLWRETVTSVSKEYPDINLSHMYVDNAAMQLVRNPAQFDVILTNNIFGDILSDEASQITGSIGMLPSASLGAGICGLYEPIHGSAPDIAGKDTANPIATILSVAMMFRHSFHLQGAAEEIENAVSTVISAGARTPDLAERGTIGTKEMGARILAELKK